MGVAEGDRYEDMQPVENEVRFGVQGYGAIMLQFTDNEVPDAPAYSIPTEMVPAVFEYETNPEWDYTPPNGCICNIKTWDISLLGLGYDQRISGHTFCLIRDIAGTNLDYLKNLKVKPIFDTAEVIKSIYPVTATFSTIFIIPQSEYDKKQDVSLLIEQDTLQGDCKIFINGNELFQKAFVRRTVYDYFNFVVDIWGYVKPGYNKIRISWPSANEFDGLKSSVYII